MAVARLRAARLGISWPPWNPASSRSTVRSVKHRPRLAPSDVFAALPALRISLWAGEPAALRSVLEEAGYRVVSPAGHGLLRLWAEELQTHPALVRLAAQRVEAAHGRTGAPLRRSPADWGAMIDHLHPHSDAQRTLLRWLLLEDSEFRSWAPEVRLLRLYEWAGIEARPRIALRLTEELDRLEVGQLARLLDRLLERAPAAAAVLFGSVQCAERLMASVSSRAASTLAPGWFELGGPVLPPELERREPEGASSQADADASASANAEAEPDGAQEVRQALRHGDHDLARSAAERFLYTQLQRCPKTAGLFELNLRTSLGLPRESELDLCCAPRRIAVELDGYFHFTGPDAYRRDRRKDLALQRAGWIVLRFLAEDVVSDLEAILSTIAAVVEERADQRILLEPIA